MITEKLPLLGFSSKITRSRRNQIIAVTGVTLCMLSNGCSGGFSAVALPSFIEPNSEIKASHAELSWIACMSTVGCILGNFIGGVISDFVGRRTSILFTSIISFMGWIAIGTAVNLDEIFVGRALTGLATGLYSAPIQVYICEIVDPSIRGVAGAAPSLTVAIGIVTVYVLGSLLYWRTLALTCSACPVLVLLYVYFLPESPTWLDAHNKGAAAIKARAWLGRDPPCDPEKNDAESAINSTKEKKMGLKFRSPINPNFFRPAVLKSLCVGLMLFFFQQCQGIFPILSYTTLIFRFSGQFMNEYLETIFVGFIRLFSTILSIFLIKFLRRKTLLIVSGALMFFANGILGTFFYFKEAEEIAEGGNFTIGNFEAPPMAEDSFEWIPLACLLVFMAGFSIGYGVVPWFLTPDLFPSDVRSLGCSIVFTFGQICRVTTVKTFLDLVDFLGADGTFWMYSGVSFTSILFITFCVPETDA